MYIIITNFQTARTLLYEYSWTENGRFSFWLHAALSGSNWIINRIGRKRRERETGNRDIERPQWKENYYMRFVVGLHLWLSWIWVPHFVATSKSAAFWVIQAIRIMWRVRRWFNKIENNWVNLRNFSTIMDVSLEFVHFMNYAEI